MPSPRTLVAASLAALATLAVLASCGGPSDDKKKILPMFAKRCPSFPRAQVVNDAVTQFITTATPTPQLFLYIPATDSSLPDAGVRALQNKGNTFLYSQDPALQKQMRAKLGGIDYYTSMLVVYKGLEQPDSTHAVVRLGGHYIGTKSEKEPAVARALSFQCDSTEWRFVEAK
ncbi:MAG TPA: hypothetical protein VKA84_24600 [Gemmatimonadaceae bacterium]|nr:hypothetical protein [Gemmatimonadaceae bacterium]